jgi:hypothetical protein
VFTKDRSLTLLQIPWNGRQTKNTIFQHTKPIIIDVPKSSMPQEARRQCTSIMVRKVCRILCPCRSPFQLQQLVIFPSCHDDHVVKRSLYFNFPIKCVNGMALLSNVHKRQQVPQQLMKIKNILQKKIRESTQFKPDGANFCRFKTGSICKTYCTINIFIKFLK